MSVESVTCDERRWRGELWFGAVVEAVAVVEGDQRAVLVIVVTKIYQPTALEAC